MRSLDGDENAAENTEPKEKTTGDDQGQPAVNENPEPSPEPVAEPETES